ncbi:hypothetical protein ACO0KY_05540 [Undibacterium sp. Dicai25W]|uniref:hypothetical protein n=1 Tax=Undibacterium sp. Dicai25W TaxID=3413034 RepID=UPI003BF1310C
MPVTLTLKNILKKILHRFSFVQRPQQRRHLLVPLIVTLTISTNLYAEPIKLYYENRVPFMFLENNQLKGTLGLPATETFKAAGLAFTLSEAPVARQELTITNNTEAACAIGYYWTTNRAKSGKYTLAIAHGMSQGIIIRSDNPKMHAINTMESLLDAPSLTIALRHGYSYGETVDKLLLQSKARVLRPSDDSHGRVKLVAMAIVDAALFTPEEAAYQIKQFGTQANGLTFRQLHDSPEGKPRYLYCSKMVGDETIQKLNAAIKKRR